MKNLIAPLIVFAVVIAGCIFISSKSSEASHQENQIVPRYHVFYPGVGPHSFVYDSVTGDYKSITINEVKKNNNLRTLLEN
jgi:flagellar basal body-associated protein FliL